MNYETYLKFVRIERQCLRGLRSCVIPNISGPLEKYLDNEFSRGQPWQMFNLSTDSLQDDFIN